MGLKLSIQWTVMLLLMSAPSLLWITVDGLDAPSDQPVLVAAKELKDPNGSQAKRTTAASQVVRTNFSHPAVKVSKSSVTKKPSAVISARCSPTERCDLSPFSVKWAVTASVKSSSPVKSGRNKTPSKDKANSESKRPERPPNPQRPQRNATITILALVDLSGKSTGQQLDGVSLLQTAQIALNQVNAQQIIPGFQMELVVNDSKVSEAFEEAVRWKRGHRLT